MTHTKHILMYINLSPSLEDMEEIKTWFKAHEQIDVSFFVLREKEKGTPRKGKDGVTYIVVDFESDLDIYKKLEPYKEEILAMTCYGESNISRFRKVIPHVPYLRTPTEGSLYWATDKIEMRKKFTAYDKSLGPKFMLVSDAEEKTIDSIIKKIGFPLVVKPAGLMSSLLVTDCHYKEELELSLKKIFKKLEKVYSENNVQNQPRILVEEFMDGRMYSIDAYVTSRGKVYCLPPVYVKTGKDIGIDDFFNYFRLTPTSLTKDSVSKAEEATKKGIHALGLRSTTVHAELLYTNKGWKIIEMGPRIGGFRDTMYDLAYGIPHRLNDILIRMPKKPVLPKKKRGYCAILRIYPKKPGIILKIEGLRKIKSLPSVLEVKQKSKKGDRITYSKQGGKPVGDIILFNKDRSALMGDVRKIEKEVRVLTK